MRSYSALHPTEEVPIVPDTVQTLLLVAATGQAMDWANSTIGSSDAEAHMVRFTGVTTAGATLNFHVNLISTHASLPASGTSITTGTSLGSTGNTVPVLGERIYQIPSFSTGWSAIARTSGYVMAEVWRK